MKVFFVSRFFAPSRFLPKTFLQLSFRGVDAFFTRVAPSVGGETELSEIKMQRSRKRTFRDKNAKK
jgi:hypothetical protein